MPHLTVQYSQNLDHYVDMKEFCSVMSVAMQQTGVFPGGHSGAGASDAAVLRRRWAFQECLCGYGPTHGGGAQ